MARRDDQRRKPGRMKPSAPSDHKLKAPMEKWRRQAKRWARELRKKRYR